MVTERIPPSYFPTLTINDIANSLDKELQFTFDVPSQNVNGKLLVLDLAMYIMDGKVMYTFYKKKVSSVFTVLKRSLFLIEQSSTLYSRRA